MEPQRTLLSALALVLLLGTYGVAIGGGGAEPTQTLPHPASGPLILVEWTADLDNSPCVEKEPQPIPGGKKECPHINVHLKLKYDKQVRQMKFWTTLGTKGVKLCEETVTDIIKNHEFHPKNHEFEKQFGLTGTPVIDGLSITNKDFCDDQKKIIIGGTAVIRVVP